jgi:lipopolysaccharide assembly outer membrane protein LptD (OstA)|tara:strand:+ start:415 stop:1032 length:618 start_codon:yes stop_codon:yes gene_type:complete
MERRKKLKAIQLCLLSIGVLTLIFTYSDKISFKKDLITQELKKEIENKTIDKNESIKGNVFYNIEYSGLDLAGNRYILKSKSATNNNLNKDLIDMTGVTATFYFKDGTVLKIKSDFGEYNNNTLDINFKSNINAEYGESTLKAQYAEYSNSQGFLKITDNVIVNDIQGNLVADKLLFDIKSQTLKIETFKDNRISVNVDTDEKRF